MSSFAAASPRRKAAAGALIVLLAWGLTLGLNLAGILTKYSLTTLDHLYRATPLPPASGQVVVVTVGQADLDFFQKQGVSWPWPRQLYAPIIEFCRRGPARGVIFDVQYFETSVYGADDDQRLAQAMAGSGRVVLPFFLTREAKGPEPQTEAVLNRAALSIKGIPPPGLTAYQGVTPPIAPLLKAAAALGNVECGSDPDGIYRRLPLVSLFLGRFLPLLTFGAFCHFEAPGEWRFEGGGLVQGSRRAPLDEEGRVLLKFRGPGRSFTRFSAANIIQSEERLKHGLAPFHQPEELAGKWVLVGFTAPGLLDLKPTPLAPVFPGVELHATLLDNLLTGDFLRTAPQWLIWLWAFLLAAGVTLAVLFSPRLWATLAALGLLMALNVGGSFLAFWNSWWLDPVAPGAALALAFALATAYSYATEGRQKLAIRRMFSHYMSEKVISHLMDHPELLNLGGERRRMTLFFSDLAGFTTISERLSAEEVVGLLNDYLSRMTDIILDEEGVVDKFEGDAIMAFWGAPLPQADQALRACRAAWRQQAALMELNEGFREMGLPPLSMRIGLHSGEAVVGNLGSEKRFDYTAIGDTVNLASRLEGLNKFYGTHIMASETTAAECKNEVLFREVDRVAVKGKEKPVAVFQPLGLAEGAAADQIELCQDFARALQVYRQANFSEAAGLFQNILAKYPGDGPSQTFLERCQGFLASPPPVGWDGVFRADKK
jgi:adenylate cyclase